MSTDFTLNIRSQFITSPSPINPLRNRWTILRKTLLLVALKFIRTNSAAQSLTQIEQQLAASANKQTNRRSLAASEANFPTQRPVTSGKTNRSIDLKREIEREKKENISI